MQLSNTATPLGLLIATPMLAIAALVLGCNGGGSDANDDATSTATASSATATTQPTVTASSSPAASPTPTLEPTPTPTPEISVSPVDPFEVRSTDAINVRSRPSTAGDLVTTIFPGETVTVTGETVGEEVEPGDNVWYQVDVARDGDTVRGFLYAAYVAAVP